MQEDLVDRYCRAFRDGDTEAALALFHAESRFELPLLGQRLVGRAELRAGHDLIAGLTASRSIELSGRRAKPNLAIAEGVLHARLHRDPAAVSIPMALVAHTRDDRLARLSFYLDARPYRLWADGPILARGA